MRQMRKYGIKDTVIEKGKTGMVLFGTVAVVLTLKLAIFGTSHATEEHVLPIPTPTPSPSLVFISPSPDDIHWKIASPTPNPINLDVSRYKIPKYDWNKDKRCPTYIGEEMFRIWRKKGGAYSYVPYCIAWYESRFNTASQQVTSKEDSRGLFQVNMFWHSENFKNENQAYNPRTNMEYQFGELIRYEKKGIEKGLRGVPLICYVAKHGQRPTWTSTIEKEIADSYKYYKSNLIGGNE
jgi:hypothetical protein